MSHPQPPPPALRPVDIAAQLVANDLYRCAEQRGQQPPDLERLTRRLTRRLEGTHMDGKHPDEVPWAEPLREVPATWPVWLFVAALGWGIYLAC